VSNAPANGNDVSKLVEVDFRRNLLSVGWRYRQKISSEAYCQYWQYCQ